MTAKSVRRVALVTGAASGIGAAAIRKLLEDGHWVCAADIQDIPVDDIQKPLRARLKATRCDVSNWPDCQRAVAETVQAFGGLDTLLHFAAIHSVLPWDELEPEEFNHVLAVNVTGSFLITKAAATHMKGHGGGAIVMTGSGSMNSGGLGGHGRGGPAYTSSKGAIVALHRAMAKSLAPHGIRVNAVSPGATTTAMTADYSADALRRVGDRTALGRIGTAAEIAAVAIFLASDEASYVTGEIVNVNGGGSFGI